MIKYNFNLSHGTVINKKEGNYLENYDPSIHGTIADWVSGIGSLFAIITSLYLTMRDNYKKAIVTSYFNFEVYDTGDVSNEYFLSIEVVNNGKIPINVTKVGVSKFKMNKYAPQWLKNLMPKTFGMQQFIQFREESNKLPTMLESQGLANFSVLGAANNLRGHSKIAKKTKVFVQDSTGKYYFSRNKLRL